MPCLHLGHRSIPAPAGEPDTALLYVGPLSVYPRACGGTWNCRMYSKTGTGLSPRLRGNRGPGVRLRHIRGSIPAPAGEPCQRQSWLCLQTVYPRACGGTHRSIASSHRLLGLSPRLRGNRPGGNAALHPRGSIPAPAGEPPTRGGGASLPAVYPRACGGTPVETDFSQNQHGLSPRLRGNLRWRWSGLRWVYPRACGGTIDQIRPGFVWQGLSPRLRGNRSA